MATTTSELINEVTHLCSICLEQYKLPVVLPCSHSFCQTCLAAHITSSCVNLDPPLGFPCPLCRVFIPAPGRFGQYSVDNWATKFPKNKLLECVIDENCSCKPCQEDGEEVKASSWCLDCSEPLCKTCEKYHTKPKPCRHHVVVSLTDLSGTCKKSDSLENCETHDGRKLELFCEKHVVPCCSVCVTQEHSNCNGLFQLTEVNENLVGPEQVKSLQKELEKFCSTLEKTIREEKANMDTIDDVSDKFTKELSEFTQAIIQKVKHLEEKHLDELAKLSKESKSKLNQSVESFEQRLQYILHWKEILMKSKETLPTNCVLSYTKMKNIFEGLKSLTYSKFEISIQTKFPENAEKLKIITRLAEINSSEHLNDVKFNLRELNVATAEVKFINKFKISGSTDVFDGDFQKNGTLLLAVYRSNASNLIICNIDGILQEKKLSGTPYGVCISGGNEVLVTLPKQNTVLKLDSDSLDIKETVSLPCRCYGIAVSASTAVIGARNSVVMFPDGLIGKRPTTLSSDLPDTDDVALDNEDNVIYCSYSKHTVRKQDKFGNILFTYTHTNLKRPYGLAVNRNGEIFVSGNISSNIHILTKNGELLRILEGVERPAWIKFQDDTNQLFVTCMKKGSYVQVLEFISS